MRSMEGTQNVIASLVGKTVRQRDGQDGEKGGRKSFSCVVFQPGVNTRVVPRRLCVNTRKKQNAARGGELSARVEHAPGT